MRYTKHLLLLLIVFFAIRLWWQKEVEKRENESFASRTGFESYQYKPQSVGSYQYIVKEPEALRQLGNLNDTLWHKEKSATLWEVLRKVEYEQTEAFYKARFSNELQALEGKQVSLKGFMIPLEENNESQHFVLSYFPYASCFFCGGGGPESVVEIFAQQPIAFTDKPLTIRGKLQLNRDNPEKLFFAITEAVVE
ncbi:MAG: DUF3299 domain-containing protein [Cytophagales bacterium]|nr:DUF3299 domain-containing protein [Bernardetiaceae bacterium]MDW8205707.1 DUF3299 domain-containing protein [Cytophagales bacterium]